MSIWVNSETKVVVQGLTGKEGRFHAEKCREYGTQIVAGVTPGKAGQRMDDVPVFNTVSDAVIRPVAMLASTIGDGARASGEARKSPGTRAKVVSMLRAELLKARDYVEKQKAAADDDEKEDESPLNAGALAGLQLRGIGPAFTSGRIADLALDPADPGLTVEGWPAPHRVVAVAYAP